MRFLHLADLHIGKSIYGTNLIDSDDQKVWVERFLQQVRELKPEAVVIAGDVYDRGLPPGRAALMLSTLVTELAEMDIYVLITAGNHDSIHHLSFLRSLLETRKVYISRPMEQGPELVHLSLKDEYGPVTFWLLPYVYPAMIAQVLQDESIKDYDTAVRRILAAQPVDFKQRNVLIAHQNVTANGQEIQRGGSESMVGGVGQVDYTAFDGFDYVALGHIHSSYAVGRDTVRYAGSPLAYHYNETKQPVKGPLLVIMPEKDGKIIIERQEIEPLHRMREIRDSYDRIREQFVSSPCRNEYLKVVLTDQRISPMISDFIHENAKALGSTVLELTSEYNAFTGEAELTATKEIHEKPIEALFADFYRERNNGTEADAAELELMAKIGEMTRNAPVGQARPDDKDFQTILDFVLRQEVDGE